MNPIVPHEPNQPPPPAPEHRNQIKFNFQVVGDGSINGGKNLVAQGQIGAPNISAALALLSGVACSHPERVDQIVLQRVTGSIILPPGRG